MDTDQLHDFAQKLIPFLDKYTLLRFRSCNKDTIKIVDKILSNEPMRLLFAEHFQFKRSNRFDIKNSFRVYNYESRSRFTIDCGISVDFSGCVGNEIDYSIILSLSAMNVGIDSHSIPIFIDMSRAIGIKIGLLEKCSNTLKDVFKDYELHDKEIIHHASKNKGKWNTTIRGVIYQDEWNTNVYHVKITIECTKK